MKLFKTSNTETVKNRQKFLGFEIPSVVWIKRVDKFESKFAEFTVFDFATVLALNRTADYLDCDVAIASCIFVVC